jgi:alcohol dehydrogenase class IV
MKYYMPTKVVTGKNCIKENADLFLTLGSKALIVTGKRSAKINGSQKDIEDALNSKNIPYVLFDSIEANPTIEMARSGADLARKEKVDFIIGCGGGSPLDASKAIAILAANDLDDKELFSNVYGNKPLPIAAIPTTAGTGSEVTPYSILTDDSIKSKHSIGCEAIFPKIAFLDAAYTESLKPNTTINTAIDALSHAVEGYLSTKANDLSDLFAEKSMTLLGECLNLLDKDISFEIREKLLYASMLGGVVISHTGTTAVHAMGYSLTYFKHVDHGRANGLLMYEYLKLISKTNALKVDKIIKMLGIKKLEEFNEILTALLKEKEKISEEEIKLYASIAIKTKNIGNTLGNPTVEDLENIFKNSLSVIDK